MGIRYDRDSKRATNGPLIFFNDPSSKSGFSEEVRGALISGLSFYSYRLPGDLMISFGSSEGVVEGIGVPGFVIGMFDPQKPYITIPYRGCKSNYVSRSLCSFPMQSTTYEEYSAEVEDIISKLRSYPHGKVVAARVELRETTIDIAETFFDFMQRFPNAMVFCFSTPATGCWIGASPELLLDCRNNQIKSMALAGTRKNGTDIEWDLKNIEEQRIVTDYIVQVFRNSNLTPIMDTTYTKTYGSIEHLCTPFSAFISEVSEFNLDLFLKSLSPTPALCGYPKEFAFAEIRKFEKFDRGCYGGFCGPFHALNDFTFNVVLRCATILENRYCIYSGGGITIDSDVSMEWKETEIKMINTFGKQ